MDDLSCSFDVNRLGECRHIIWDCIVPMRDANLLLARKPTLVGLTIMRDATEVDHSGNAKTSSTYWHIWAVLPSVIYGDAYKKEEAGVLMTVECLLNPSSIRVALLFADNPTKLLNKNRTHPRWLTSEVIGIPKYNGCSLVAHGEALQEAIVHMSQAYWGGLDRILVVPSILYTLARYKSRENNKVVSTSDFSTCVLSQPRTAVSAINKEIRERRFYSQAVSAKHNSVSDKLRDQRGPSWLAIYHSQE